MLQGNYRIIIRGNFYYASILRVEEGDFWDLQNVEGQNISVLKTRLTSSQIAAEREAKLRRMLTDSKESTGNLRHGEGS